FTRHFLPGVLAFVHAEIDFPAFHLGRQQHAPTVFWHANVIELGPALRVNADCSTEINQRLLKAFGPHIVPPVEIAGMPFFKSALDAYILPEGDIVWNHAVIVDLGDIHGYTLSLLNV